jgi:hypothetical protein
MSNNINNYEIPRLQGVNNININPFNDIRPAQHNTLSSNDRWAVADNMFASVDADTTLGVDMSGLSTNTPGRSLEAIISERIQAIQTLAEPIVAGDGVETIRKNLVAFVNQIFESSAQFLKDSCPCAAAETAAAISASAKPSEEELLGVARQTINDTLNVEATDEDNYDTFKRQSLAILENYRTLGRDLIRQEQTFKSKLAKYDKIAAQIKSLTDITGIEDTPEMANLLKSYGEALKVAAEKFNFGEEYTLFLQKHREWVLLRDILMLHRVPVSDAQPGPTCGVCLEDPVTHALTSCGHTFCANCRSQLGRACPLCRKTITGAMKVFFN